MANVLEFVLRLKDMMSAGMAGATSRVQNNFSQLTRTVQTAGRNVDMLDARLDQLRNTVRLSVDLTEIRRANREIDQLEHKRDGLQNLGRRRGLGIGSMGRNLIAAVGIAGGLGLAGNVLGQGMQAGARQVSFEVLAGKQQGTQLNNQLTKFAQDSIYGTEVYKDAQTMLGFGISAGKIMPTMKMLGDVAMGDAQKLGSLTLAFSQIQAAGRLQGQDLLQLINAGFNPLQEISAATGKSIGTLKQAMEKGGISAAMVTGAFERATGAGGRFFNMTQRIGETPFGKWQALQGQVQGLAMQLGQALTPALGNLISNYLAPLVDFLSQTVTWFQANWEWISYVGEVVGIAAGAYALIVSYTKVWTAYQWLLNAAMTANPIGLIVAGVAALVAGIVLAWNKFAGFRGAVLGVWEVLKGLGILIKDYLVDSIKSMVSGISGIGTTIMLLFKGNWKEAAEAGKKAVMDLAQVNTVKHTIENGAKLGDAFKKGYAQGLTSGPIKSPFATALPAGATPGISGAPSSSLTDLKGTAEGVSSGGSKTVNITVQKFFDTINVNSASVSEGADQIADIITEQLTRILYSAAAVTTS